MPPMTAQAADLTHQLQREHHGHKRPRVPMLDLLASGHTQTRQAGARLLGVQRHTIERWLAIDVAGGLEAL